MVLYFARYMLSADLSKYIRPKNRSIWYAVKCYIFRFLHKKSGNDLKTTILGTIDEKYSLQLKTVSPKSWPHFIGGGGGGGGGAILGNSKLKVPSPDQIFIFLGGGGGGGGVFLATQNSKSQVLTKFSFWGGRVFLATQTSKFQVLTKFSLGRGVFLATQNSKSQPNFYLEGWGGGGGFFAKNRVLLAKWAKHSPSPS